MKGSGLDDPPQYPEKQSPSPGWGTDSFPGLCFNPSPSDDEVGISTMHAPNNRVCAQNDAPPILSENLHKKLRFLLEQNNTGIIMQLTFGETTQGQLETCLIIRGTN